LRRAVDELGFDLVAEVKVVHVAVSFLDKCVGGILRTLVRRQCASIARDNVDAGRQCAIIARDKVDAEDVDITLDDGGVVADGCGDGCGDGSAEEGNCGEDGDLLLYGKLVGAVDAVGFV